MSAPTVAVRHAIVQAGEKGLLHIGSQRDTGTWVARCGRQVRGRDIRAREGRAGVAYAVEHAEQMCPDCADLAEAVAVAVDWAAGR